MQSISSRIWTRVVVSISYDDNHYTTGTCKSLCVCCVRVCIRYKCWCILSLSLSLSLSCILPLFSLSLSLSHVIFLARARALCLCVSMSLCVSLSFSHACMRTFSLSLYFFRCSWYIIGIIVRNWNGDTSSKPGLVLYIDLRAGQTCHSKVMHRKEVTHSDGSYEKKLHRRAWLKKWDKVKSHGTLIDWSTWREWPVNCMTVISAWWRSNMPFQRLSGRLNYYIPQWR